MAGSLPARHQKLKYVLFMAKIINLSQLKQEIGKIKKTHQTIILVGGCFDILHIGHIRFLKEAKKIGGCLLVLLESDKTVTRLKGAHRPYFSQKDRSEVLSAMEFVDYVVMMTPLNTDEDYINLSLLIKPDFIAVTANDPQIDKKRKQTELVKGKLKIIPFWKTFSSSKVAKLLGVE